MKDYIFKGKRLDNGEWVYGDLCHGSGGKCYIAYDQDFVDTCSCGINDLITDRFFEVDPETVGQYTGHKDKSENSVNIFSGDILHCVGIGNNADEEYLAEVVYDEENAAFMLDVGCELRSFAEMDGLCELFVIGNSVDKVDPMNRGIV